MSKNVKIRGRRPFIADKMNIKFTLEALASNMMPENVSKFVMMSLVEKGYVEYVDLPHTGKRGRPSKTFQITAKGRNYVRLSQFWIPKKVAEEVPVELETEAVA